MAAAEGQSRYYQGREEEWKVLGLEPVTRHPGDSCLNDDCEYCYDYDCYNDHEY